MRQAEPVIAREPEFVQRGGQQLPESRLTVRREHCSLIVEVALLRGNGESPAFSEGGPVGACHGDTPSAGIIR